MVHSWRRIGAGFSSTTIVLVITSYPVRLLRKNSKTKHIGNMSVMSIFLAMARNRARRKPGFEAGYMRARWFVTLFIFELAFICPTGTNASM